MAQMAVLRARALDELSRVDLLLVPTALSHWTVEEVQEEECAQPPTWGRNAKLGRFTNFVNLLDMCGIAVPSGLVSYDSAQLGEVRTVAAPQQCWGEMGCRHCTLWEFLGAVVGWVPARGPALRLNTFDSRFCRLEIAYDKGWQPTPSPSRLLSSRPRRPCRVPVRPSASAPPPWPPAAPRL